MRLAKALGLFALFTPLAGCAALGIKSVPWPTSVTVHDADAINFLRKVPLVDGELGAGLKTKNMLADNRLVGFSASGGGARATAFTLGVLTELQQVRLSDGSNALDSIDFMSSNSGGSWGVAAYLSDRAQRKDENYSLLQRMLPSREESVTDRFVKLGEGAKPCWSRAMRTHVFKDRTYADVYYEDNPDPLPSAFINAALLPSQSPFVFTDKFLAYFQTTRFGACDDDWVGPDDNAAQRTIANLPFGYAAAASGTVPSFYYAYATTALCEKGNGVASASFCHAAQNGKALDYLRIADGGVYDNLGYKTAYEVMSSLRQTAAAAKKAMILVNSNPSTDLKTIRASKRDSSFFGKLATNGMFGVQDATFERSYGPMFRSLGVEQPVLLDFFSTAGFRGDQVTLIADLPELAFVAAHNVTCFDGEKVVKARARPVPKMPSVSESVAELVRKAGDCLSENFYRVGNRGKTTYKFDRLMFTELWQLGRLSVRMNCPAIVEAIEGPGSGQACDYLRQTVTVSEAQPRRDSAE